MIFFMNPGTSSGLKGVHDDQANPFGAGDAALGLRGDIGREPEERSSGFFVFTSSVDGVWRPGGTPFGPPGNAQLRVKGIQ